jgi:hypothetical protein
VPKVASEAVSGELPLNPPHIKTVSAFEAPVDKKTKQTFATKTTKARTISIYVLMYQKKEKKDVDCICV